MIMETKTKAVTPDTTFYCVLAESGGVELWCWWSLAPTEEDSWRFFVRGCVDTEAEAMERAKREGMQCLPVQLSTAEGKR